MNVFLFAALALVTAQPSAELSQDRTNSRNWKETAIVPIGASFALPEPLSGALSVPVNGNPQSIKLSYTGVPPQDVTSFLATGIASEVLQRYVTETSDIRVLDSFLAASLGYLTANASTSRTSIVVIEQWRKYLPVTITVSNLPQRVLKWDQKEGWQNESAIDRRARAEVSGQVGFSMSIVTRIDSTDARVSTGNLLRAYSAGVNFQSYSALSSTEVIGLSDSKITANLPSASDFLNAQINAGNGTDQAAGYRRHQALVAEMASKFKILRGTAWNAGNLRPMLIGLDLDALERLTGQVYEGYSQGRR